MLKGKKLSILGDSISTYRGVSNDAAANYTIAENPWFYRPAFPLEKTYWSRLMRTFGLTLCVNNSWSGGNLSGGQNPCSGVNRAHHLANNSGEKPDFIIVFMGINDLGRGVRPAVFAEDYEKTLAIIQEKYPSAKVCCVNLPNREPSVKKQTEVFNKIIEGAVSKAGERFFIADLFSSRLNNDFYYINTVDGLHPDEDGAAIIAETLEGAFLSYLKIPD